MLDILYCFDDKYSRVVAVSTLSVLKFNKDVRFHFFTVGNIAHETKEKFNRIFAGYPVSVNYYDVTKELKKYSDIFVNRKFNLGTLARLVAASVLPMDYDKVLYLDGDTLVVSPLNFEEYDIDEKYVLGVYDISLPPLGVKKKLGLKNDDIYINAGVLYINLRLWRKHNLENKFYNYLVNNNDVILWDQDAINYVCKGKIGLLPIKYNMTFISSEIPYNYAKFIFEANTFDFYNKDDLNEAQKHPCIIHFAGEVLGKPWTTVSNIKYTDEWRRIDRITPWGKEKYFLRKYSNNRLIGIYKENCERIISFSYKNKDYRMVCVLYYVMYKIPHKIKSLMRIR